MRISAKKVTIVNPTIGIELEAFLRPTIEARVLGNSQKQIDCIIKAEKGAKEEFEKGVDGYPKGIEWGTDGGGTEITGSMPELRFPPESYANIYKNRAEIKRLLEIMDSHHLCSDNQVSGMHIHVQRSFITKADFDKILLMFKKNCPFLEKFSERKHRAKDYVTGPLTNPQGGMPTSESEYNTARTSHQCIRLNQPGTNVYTIEFRMFNGTLNFNKFMANIQFIERLVNFVKNHETDDLTMEAYIEFVLSSGSAYKPLLSDLEEKGLLDGSFVKEENKKRVEELEYFGFPTV